MFAGITLLFNLFSKDLKYLQMYKVAVRRVRPHPNTLLKYGLNLNWVLTLS